MQNCGRLREYARFVYEVKQNLSFGMPLERAVNTAIDTCIQQDVLKDILMQSKSEVLEMFLTEYDKKLHMENTYRERRIRTGIGTGPGTGSEPGFGSVSASAARKQAG